MSDHIEYVFGMLIIVFLLVLGIFIYAVNAARAHESWINQGAYRNKDGEWCCGEHDCKIVPKEQVHMTGQGYVVLRGPMAGVGPAQQEAISFAETLVSRDGEFWRCHRPDGTRRCFFAPTPSY